MLLSRQLTSRLCSPAQPWVKSVTRTITAHAGVSARFVSSGSRSRTDDFPALLIGAGYKLGARLTVPGIIEVSPPRAEAALARKRESAEARAYEGTVILPDVGEYKGRVERGEAPEPRAIFVATPPLYRGGLSSPRNLEVELMRLFPNSAIFLEKPVATGTPWEQSVSEAKEVGRMLRGHKAVVAVGYVLRYLKAVKEMKRIINENQLTVMATNARFVTAYELAIKTDWWNKDVQQGPIIEQGTHIVDLSRYFGGDVDMDTVCAHALEAHEKPGVLSKKRFDESVIPDAQRIPRATTASWKYESGAVGTLLHATALHGVDYAIELEVYADGYQLILADPFGTPALHIRKPGSDIIEVHPTPGDDPYFTEIDGFIDAIEGGPNASILAPYEDAARTYEMTWVIRNRSEEMTRLVLAKRGKTA
ncbi:hypothetical protein EHS25_000971 [Saitozyma podzolica]|uniref:NAD binding dehydrogenase n=1 Tax=Saitozyma podzolica TaxID=1890683 RepID=A0A427YGW6_9TREE|nr:hypothetical protein EHS25_000971 [Saitozyma podzolica]